MYETHQPCARCRRQATARCCMPLQGCPSSLYTLSPRRSHSSPCATTTCLPAPPRAARRRVETGVARHLSRTSHSRRVSGCESAVHRGRHARRCRLTLKLPPVAVQHARAPGETKGTYVQCARQPGVAQHSAHPPLSNALQLHSLPISSGLQLLESPAVRRGLARADPSRHRLPCPALPCLPFSQPFRVLGFDFRGRHCSSRPEEEICPRIRPSLRERNVLQ